MPECPTTEKIAEFIDGRIAPGDRAVVIAHLNSCKTCYAVVSESLFLRDALNDRSRARLHRFLHISIPAGLAAAAVMLIAVRIYQPSPELTGSPTSDTVRRQPSLEARHRPAAAVQPYSFARELADRLSAAAVGPTSPSSQNRPQPRTAFGFSSVVTLEKAAFRAGACLTDLELARRAKDPAQAESAALQAIEILRPWEPSLGPLPTVTAEQHGAPAGPGGFSQAVERLFRNRKEAVLLRFGSWVQAAQAAAEAGDAPFFKTADAAAFRVQMESAGVPIGTVKDLSRIEAVLSSGALEPDRLLVLSQLLADIKEMF